MVKFTFNEVSLECMMQEASEILMGNRFQGVLSKAENGKFRFEERAPSSYERNPRLYKGKYINMARDKEGRIRLSFKHFDTTNESFVLDDYAFGVYYEIITAIQGINEMN